VTKNANQFARKPERLPGVVLITGAKRVELRRRNQISEPRQLAVHLRNHAVVVNDGQHSFPIHREGEKPGDAIGVGIMAGGISAAGEQQAEFEVIWEDLRWRQIHRFGQNWR
jgi:hypothetical protein